MIRKTFALAALAALFAFPAFAAPPEYQEGGEMVMNNVMLCDEQAQIEAILTAAQTDFLSANRTYLTLNKQKSPHGGPACAFIPSNSQIPLKLVKNVMAVNDVKMPSGIVPTVYVIEVKWPAGGNWVQGFIFAEEPLAAKGVAL